MVQYIKARETEIEWEDGKIEIAKLCAQALPHMETTSTWRNSITSRRKYPRREYSIPPLKSCHIQQVGESLAKRSWPAH